MKQSHLNQLNKFENDLDWLYIPDDENPENGLEYALDIFDQIVDIDWVIEEETLQDVSLTCILEYYIDAGYTLKSVLDNLKGGYIAFGYDANSGMFLTYTPEY